MATGTKKGILTAREVEALKPGEWASDPAARGAGRLQVRRLHSGSLSWYYRYAAPNGERVRISLGSDLPLAVARERAAQLADRYRSGDRDLRAALDAEHRQAERRRQAEEAAAAAKAIRDKATLGALLTAYVQQLRTDGKISVPQVENAVKRHVETPWPALWAMPADQVSPDDLLSVVARIVDDGKLREAAKLRSYLRAAYAAAIRARQSARSIQALRDLHITTNPARDLVTIDGATNARDRALSLAELRAYWKRIVALPDPDGALLRFHLMTGGQRVDQLARLTHADIDRDTQTMLLRDSKGRRRRPRNHVVPLIEAAQEALGAIRGDLGEFAFSTTGGYSGAAYAIVQHRVRLVADAMVQAKEATAPFTPGDIRRTVETRLAAEGISADVRAQLQSHGLGGVQARHYDRHDYLAEKRAALETLHRLAAGDAAKVRSITQARARKAR